MINSSIKVSQLEQLLSEIFPEFDVSLLEEHSNGPDQFILGLSTKFTFRIGDRIDESIWNLRARLYKCLDDDIEKLRGQEERIKELEAEIQSLKSNPLARCLDLEIT